MIIAGFSPEILSNWFIDRPWLRFSSPKKEWGESLFLAEGLPFEWVQKPNLHPHETLAEQRRGTAE